MKIGRPPHRWTATPKRAVAIQRQLADRIVRRGRVRSLRRVAGVDLAFAHGGTECVAGVVVWEVATASVVEQHVVRRPITFPYVPGLLSFREAPPIIAVLRKVRSEPDVFMFDGHGYAHPRRFGLACHVGLLIDRPSLGCAKSVLVGESQTPGAARGCKTSLRHNGEVVGTALRTRDRVKPIYVSVGHRLSLEAAVEIALATSIGYRLPEPTRLADKLVARAKRS